MTRVLHDVPEGRKIIVTLVAVHTVVYSNKADVVLWKIGVGVISHLQIITSQPGHISLCQLNTKFFTEAGGG